MKSNGHARSCHLNKSAFILKTVKYIYVCVRAPIVIVQFNFATYSHTAVRQEVSNWSVSLRE